MGSELAFSPPLSFVVCYPGPRTGGGVGGGLSNSASPERQGHLLTPARRPDSHPRQAWTAPAPTPAFSPGSAPRGAHAALLSLNPANICCAPTVSHIRACRPPTSPPPPSPSRPARPVGFVTAAAEVQAPRERPERSRRMAGSDTGLPGGSRGNGGWRPLKRDRSRPTELEMGGGGGSPRAGLSPGLRPISLSSFHCPGVGSGRDLAWLPATGKRSAPAPPPPVRVIYTRAPLSGRFPIRNIDPGRGPGAVSIPPRLGI